VVLHRLFVAGEHIFELQAQGEARTRLIHDEVFTGLAQPLAAGLAAGTTREGFARMNAALKREAELGRP
jgi:hypothetical protein